MHIFITGGTRGIGKGLVIEFLKRGHKVSFTGTNTNGIEKAKLDLTGEFNGYVCDVRFYNDLEIAKDNAISNFGEIDIWINNAGVSHKQTGVSDLTEEEIKKVIDINVSGMIMGTSIALKTMKQVGKGAVYNMEGLGSDDRMIEGTLIYGSSKRLLRYFSRACNKEVKEYKNIYVGTISPGMVFTDLLLSDASPDALKIINILGNKVETVTPFLVENMLKGKIHIFWLTTRKVILKFIKSIFVKNKQNK